MLYFFEEKEENYAYNVGVKVDAEKISVSEWHLSQTAKDFYDDSDVEFFLIFKRHEAARFLESCCKREGVEYRGDSDAPSDEVILNTLHTLYNGKRSAFKDIQKAIQLACIPHEFQRW